jgi:hypothetical protein
MFRSIRIRQCRRAVRLPLKVLPIAGAFEQPSKQSNTERPPEALRYVSTKDRNTTCKLLVISKSRGGT